LATGNYNDKTARMYSDIGLLTCDSRVAAMLRRFLTC
jgi:polyphosphate kinase